MSSSAQPGKLFIGGLSFETTCEKLKTYFGKFGAVSDAVVMCDPSTHRSRGFGFITFIEPEGAESAMSTSEHMIDNRKVEAKWAVPRDTNGGGSNSSSSNGSSTSRVNHHHAHPSRKDSSHYDSRSTSRHHSNTSNNSRYDNNSSTSNNAANFSKKIFVGGLHYETCDRSLEDYFKTFGNIETAQVLYNRETNKSRGFGFLTFETVEAVDKILNTRMHTIDGKAVEVKRAVPKNEAPPPKGPSGSSDDNTNSNDLDSNKPYSSSYVGTTSSPTMKSASKRRHTTSTSITSSSTSKSASSSKTNTVITGGGGVVKLPFKVHRGNAVESSAASKMPEKSFLQIAASNVDKSSSSSNSSMAKEGISYGAVAARGVIGITANAWSRRTRSASASSPIRSSSLSSYSSNKSSQPISEEMHSTSKVDGNNNKPSQYTVTIPPVAVGGGSGGSVRNPYSPTRERPQSSASSTPISKPTKLDMINTPTQQQSSGFNAMTRSSSMGVAPSYISSGVNNSSSNGSAVDDFLTRLSPSLTDKSRSPVDIITGEATSGSVNMGLPPPMLNLQSSSSPIRDFTSFNMFSPPTNGGNQSAVEGRNRNFFGSGNSPIKSSDSMNTTSTSSIVANSTMNPRASTYTVGHPSLPSSTMPQHEMNYAAPKFNYLGGTHNSMMSGVGNGIQFNYNGNGSMHHQPPHHSYQPNPSPFNMNSMYATSGYNNMMPDNHSGNYPTNHPNAQMNDSGTIGSSSSGGSHGIEGNTNNSYGMMYAPMHMNHHQMQHSMHMNHMMSEFPMNDPRYASHRNMIDRNIATNSGAANSVGGGVSATNTMSPSSPPVSSSTSFTNDHTFNNVVSSPSRASSSLLHNNSNNNNNDLFSRFDTLNLSSGGDSTSVPGATDLWGAPISRGRSVSTPFLESSRTINSNINGGGGGGGGVLSSNTNNINSVPSANSSIPPAPWG